MSKMSRRKPRMVFQSEHVEHLEETFAHQKYPDISVLEDISYRIGIPVEKISTWFQNRRAKFKRHAKKDRQSWMRQQFYQSPSDQPSVTSSDHVITPFSADDKFKMDRKPSTNVYHMPDAPAMPYQTDNPFLPPALRGEPTTADPSHVPFYQRINAHHYQRSPFVPNYPEYPSYQMGAPFFGHNWMSSIVDCMTPDADSPTGLGSSPASANSSPNHYGYSLVTPQNPDVSPSHSTEVRPSFADVSSTSTDISPTSNMVPSTSNMVPSTSNSVPSTSNSVPSASNTVPSASNIVPPTSNVVSPTSPGVSSTFDCMSPSFTDTSTYAEPSPSTAEPSPSTAEPSPSYVEPSPSTAEPSPSTAEPSPSTAESSPTSPEPSPSTAEPSSTSSEIPNRYDSTSWPNHYDYYSYSRPNSSLPFWASTGFSQGTSSSTADSPSYFPWQPHYRESMALHLTT